MRQDRSPVDDQDRPLPAWPKLKLRMRDHTPLSEVAHTLFKVYRERSLVGLVLMIAQAFFYNAIFFTFALVLTDFYGVPAGQVELVHSSFRGWQFPGPCLFSGRFVRYAGSPSNDRVHVWHVWNLARVLGLSVCNWGTEREDADNRLDENLFLRFSGRKRCLSYRE